MRLQYKNKLFFNELFKKGASMLIAIFAFIMIASPNGALSADADKEKFTTTFRLEDCEFQSEGENPFFILKPGYQLVFSGEEDGKTIRFVMTVLSETKDIMVPGIGKVTARVVEEKEWADGKPIEFAESYFAICDKTNDVYDFGDAVEIFHSDGTVSNDGSWLTGKPDKDGVAMPGVFVPGTFFLGAKYYQQQADGLSMERGENLEMGLTVETKAGKFENCVRVLETNSIEEGVESIKTHCPGIGLVGEDELELEKFGYNIFKG